MKLSTVIKKFKNKKVVTIVMLAAWLSCSIATARRRLKAWSAYTSYNHNGRYYTLPEIADFDKNGLWQYQGVFFSKHGNLKQTLAHLVTHSAQGSSGAELGELLGLQPRSFLSHFRDHPEMFREHVRGRWIWFAAEPKIREQQKQTRLAQAVAKAPRMPTDREAVMILVDLIKHPNSGLEQVARRLKTKGLHIDVTLSVNCSCIMGLKKKPRIFPRPMFKSPFGATAKPPVAWRPVSGKAIDTLCSRSEPLSPMRSSQPGMENPHPRGCLVAYRTLHRP